jgi:hypothetical protein
MIRGLLDARDRGMPMLSGRAFRAQLVMQGQRELFDYWQMSAGARPMPARSDFDPLKVPRLLPSIGLIEVGDGFEHAIFRLAGTRLHEIYGQEITGKCASYVFCGEPAQYWRRIHDRVAGEGLPLCGVVRGPAEDRDHIVLFWLRLPLSEDGGRVDRILCYDVAGPSAGSRPQTEPLPFHRQRAHLSRPLSRQVRFG